MKRKAVFLDRDGVLNRVIVTEGKPYPPASIDELEILPGVSEALQLLKAVGYVLIVVSNQPDVKRGITSKKMVEEINNYLAKSMPLDRFIICYHDSSDDCDCRKPRPGMLYAAEQEFDLDLALSYMVGDRWRDMEAGTLAGCKTIFIDYGYAEKQPASFDYRVGSLQEAVEIILGETK